MAGKIEISEAEDISNGEEVFYDSERISYVFLDLTHYSIPRNRIADLQPVRSNIESALEQLGLHGVMLMMAFGGDETKHLKDDLNNAGIRYSAEGYSAMVLHILVRANSSPAGKPANIMVIPKPDPDSELHRVLKCLQWRDHDIFIVKPPDAEDSAQDGLFLSRSVVDCIQGLDGGKPIISGMWIDYALDNVIEDFSKPITYVEGTKTGVFWDLGDFPFPCNCDVDTIYQKIVSAFCDDDYEGTLSIWAYVDDEDGSWGGDFLRKKTWKSSIYFLPGGKNKSARSDRMLHDILLWAMDSPVDYPDPAYLIVVSDKGEDDKEFLQRLESMQMRTYSVHLVTPLDDAVSANGSKWPISQFGKLQSFA